MLTYKNLTNVRKIKANKIIIIIIIMFACQGDIMDTLVYRQLILKTTISTSCRVCKRQPESLMHVLFTHSSLAQSTYALDIILLSMLSIFN